MTTPNRTQPALSLPGVPAEAASQLRALAQIVYRINSRVGQVETGIPIDQIKGLRQELDSKVPSSRIIWTQAPLSGGRDLSADLTIQSPKGAGGVSSLDGLTGALSLVAGTNITIADNNPSPGDIKISSSSSGVPSVDGITSAVTLVAGANITITDNSPSPGDIKIAASGSGTPTITYYEHGGFVNGTQSPGSANHIELCQFYLPGNISLNQITIRTNGTDAVNLYSVGLYDSTGTLKATVTPFHTLDNTVFRRAVTGAPVALTAGLYYFAWTGASTTGGIFMDGGNGHVTNMAGSAPPETSTAGALPGSVTIPAQTGGVLIPQGIIFILT